MMTSKEQRINKLILTADSIELKNGPLTFQDNPLLCNYCKSPIFYVKIDWGIVDETFFWKEFKSLKRDRQQQYHLREIGLALFCSECGNFHEHYTKYFYPKDKIVCSWGDDGLSFADKEEVNTCLSQYNKIGDFKLQYKSNEADYLKKKLKEYESKLPGSKSKTKSKLNKKPKEGKSK